MVVDDYGNVVRTNAEIFPAVDDHIDVVIIGHLSASLHSHRLRAWPTSRNVQVSDDGAILITSSQKVARGSLWWLKELESDEHSEATQRDITFAFKHLNDMIKRKDFFDLDYVLFSLERKKLSLEVKASILRFTSPIKGRLKSWRSALKNVEYKVRDTGGDPNELLFGLL